MNKIDWSGELEAYCEDGRVVPVSLYIGQPQPDDEGDYEIVPPNEVPTAYFLEDGRPSPNGGGRHCGWHIRNRKPTTNDRLARLEDFVARVAEGGQMLALGYYEEAKALVAEIEPVDADFIEAYALARKFGWNVTDKSDKNYEGSASQMALEAIKRGRALERGEP